jgi:hypothetical protein
VIPHIQFTHGLAGQVCEKLQYRYVDAAFEVGFIPSVASNQQTAAHIIGPAGDPFSF